MTGEPSGDITDDDGDVTQRKRIKTVLTEHPYAAGIVAVIVAWLVYTLVISPPTNGSDVTVESSVTGSQSYPPLPTVTTAPDRTPLPSAGASEPSEEPIGGVAIPRSIAEGFAGDFTDARPGWWDRISRWTVPALAEQYRSTSLDRLPRGAVSSLTEHAAGRVVVDFAVAYDSGEAVGVRVEYVDGQWKVTRAVPMDTKY